MKITVNLDDSLLHEIKHYAAQNQITLRAALESALYSFLQHQKTKTPLFQMRRATFSGNGLHADIQYGDWNQLQSRIYKDQGG